MREGLDYDRLVSLTEERGVPGYEDRVRDAIAPHVGRVRSDAMGNLVGTVEERVSVGDLVSMDQSTTRAGYGVSFASFVAETCVRFDSHGRLSETETHVRFDSRERLSETETCVRFDSHGRLSGD